MAHIIKIQDGIVVFEATDSSTYDVSVTVKGTVDATKQLKVAGNAGLAGQILTSQGPGLPQTWENNLGFSGYSGYSGYNGASGFSGYSGVNGTIGVSGFSGYSGIGISGFSGYSGATVIGGAYTFTQVTPSTTWNIPHNLGYRYINIEIVDSSGVGFTGRYDYPVVTFVDSNNITLTFTTPVAGFAAVTSGGGISGFSGTSGTPGAASASGYSGAIGASGYSGVKGDTGAGTSGYSGAPGATSLAGAFVYNQNTPSASWTVVHNLGQQYVNVEVIDAAGVSYAGRYDYPTITFVDANTTLLTFISAVTGHVSVTSGGGISGFSGTSGISGFSGTSGVASIGGGYVFTQSTPSTTWNVPHNLGIQYVNIEIADASGVSYAGRYDYPTITFVDTNNLTLTFTSAVTGYAAVTSGGGVSGFSGVYQAALAQVGTAVCRV
jgi:hypothetical protein